MPFARNGQAFYKVAGSSMGASVGLGLGAVGVAGFVVRTMVQKVSNRKTCYNAAETSAMWQPQLA